MTALALTIALAALAALCAGCAGFTLNTPTQDMFLMDGDDGEYAPVVNFGPPAASLKGLDADAIKEILLAYAKAASEWMTFSPRWTQSIGTDTQTDAEASARIRAALAKEITGDTGTGDGGP